MYITLKQLKLTDDAKVKNNARIHLQTFKSVDNKMFEFTAERISASGSPLKELM